MIENYNHMFGDGFRKQSIGYSTFFAGDGTFCCVEFTYELCLFFIGKLVVHSTRERRNIKGCGFEARCELSFRTVVWISCQPCLR
jgi:hypothetical protein